MGWWKATPDGVITMTNMYLNGHGPAPPDKQWIQIRACGRGSCDVPECRKCIRDYRRSRDFPRVRAESEVFI